MHRCPPKGNMGSWRGRRQKREREKGKRQKGRNYVGHTREGKGKWRWGVSTHISLNNTGSMQLPIFCFLVHQLYPYK